MDLSQPLHPSPSTSYLASPTYPTPPRLLSQPSSRTNLRSLDKSYSQRFTTSRSSPALPKPGAFAPEHHLHHQQQERSHKGGVTRPGPPKKRPSRQLQEENWLLRTASSIALTSLEEDGLSWLGKRESSTSLHDLEPSTSENLQNNDNYYTTTTSHDYSRNPAANGITEDIDDDESTLENLFHTSPLLHSSTTPRSRSIPGSRSTAYSRLHSGRTSRAVSKPASRAMSRVSLALPLEEVEKEEEKYGDNHDNITGKENGKGKGKAGSKAVNNKTKVGGEPDWVDPEEIRRVEEEMSRRLAIKEGNDDEDGLEEEDVIDEGEMRKVVLGRVGGFIDWAVGWMEGRETDGADYEEEDETQEAESGAHGAAAAQHRRRMRRRNREMQGVVDHSADKSPPPPPPSSAANAGMLDDAKWLLGVAKQVAF